MNISGTRLLFWLILVASGASLVIAVLFLVVADFGEDFSPEFLAPSDYENRVDVADFFVGLAGFSAATVALIKTYETVRDAQKSPILDIKFTEVQGQLSVSDSDSYQYKLPSLGFNEQTPKSYLAELDLQIENSGSLAAQRIVCKVMPGYLNEDVHVQRFNTGFSIIRDSYSLDVLLEDAEYDGWNVVEVGEGNYYLRFEGRDIIDLIPGDILKIARLNLAIGIIKGTSLNAIAHFRIPLNFQLLALNAEPTSKSIEVTF